MSLNDFSTDLQETPWWQHPQQQQQSIMETTTQNSNSNSSGSSSSYKIQTTTTQQQFSSWPNSPHQFYHHQPWLNSYNNNNNNPHNTVFSFNEEREREDQQMTNRNGNTNQEHEPEFAKEPMFEKPLTPSDVGKLNRLVIPKQHAEKYFPLGGGGGGDSGSDKGLLLSFEDESGKCWRFRYSYWNSSQSYVLTKGWSRYVKEKRLDAGDVILFERHRSDSDRLFIGWRRRGAAAAQDAQSTGAAAGGWSRGLHSNHPYPGVTVPTYQHAGSVAQGQTTSAGSSKTLRLFGVNLECQADESEASELGQGLAHQQFNYSMGDYNPTDGHSHMDYEKSLPDGLLVGPIIITTPGGKEYLDISFSQDANQMMRNRQG